MNHTPTDLLLALAHWLACFLVLAEALNKVERVSPCRRGLSWRERATEWLKAIAWALLALGAGGVLISPVLYRTQQPPSLADVCIAAGFAVLIVRTRIKEG